MTTTIRTDAQNQDFVALIKLLDEDLAARYGEKQAFFGQFNKLDQINHVVVAYIHEKAMGCAAIKKYDDENTEIKRMFVRSESRGKGVAQQIMAELEQWAKELGFQNCILETGDKQPEAINLYLKCGYVITENYGQYIGVEESICMKKTL